MQQSGSRGLIWAVNIHPVSSKDPKRRYGAAVMMCRLYYNFRRTSPLLFGYVDAAAARIRNALAAFHTQSRLGSKRRCDVTRQRCRKGEREKKDGDKRHRVRCLSLTSAKDSDIPGSSPANILKRISISEGNSTPPFPTCLFEAFSSINHHSDTSFWKHWWALMWPTQNVTLASYRVAFLIP